MTRRGEALVPLLGPDQADVHVSHGRQSPQCSAHQPANPHNEMMDSGGTMQSARVSFLDDYTVIDGAFVTTFQNASHTFTPNNRIKFSKHDQPAGTLHVMDANNPKTLEAINVADDSVQDYCLNGNKLCTVNQAGVFKVWEKQESGSWTTISELHYGDQSVGGGQSRFEISENGQYVMHTVVHEERSTSDDVLHCTVQVMWFDTSESPASVIATKSLEGNYLQGLIGNILFSAGGKGVLIERGDHCVVWPDFSNENLRFDLRGEQGEWSKDGHAVVTYDVSADASHIWDMTSLPDFNVSADRPVCHVEPLLTVQGKAVGVSGNRVVSLKKSNGEVVDCVEVHDLEASCLLGRLPYSTAVTSAASKQYNVGSSSTGSPRFQKNCCISRDGRVIACCAGRRVTVYDASSCVPVWATNLDSAESECLGVQFGVDHRLFVFMANEVRVYTYDIVDGEGEIRCQIQCGHFRNSQISTCGRKVGAFWSVHSDGPEFWNDKWYEKIQHVWIWSLQDDRTVTLVRSGSGFKSFCFSKTGNEVITVSLDGLVALWNIDSVQGAIADYNVVFKSDIPLIGCYFQGQGSAVTLVSENGLLFVSLDGKLMKKLKRDPDTPPIRNFRFALDGSKCVMLMYNGALHSGGPVGLRTEVWDLVQQQVVRNVDLGQYTFHVQGSKDDLLPVTVGGESLIQSQALSMDGEFVLFGVKNDRQPWVLQPHVGCQEFSCKYSNNAECSYYGRVHVVGPIAFVSEDRKLVGSCLDLDNSMHQISIQSVEDCMQGSTERILTIHFSGSGGGSGCLGFSDTGEWIVWTSQQSIWVGGVHTDDRCIPSYKSLLRRNLTSSSAVLKTLLDRFGRNLLDHRDQAGWSLLAQSVEHENTEWAVDMINWAKQHDEAISLDVVVGKDSGGEVEWADNVVQLATHKRMGECVQLLTQELTGGALTVHDRCRVLGESMEELASVYPSLFTSVAGHPDSLVYNGTIQVPIQKFQHTPFAVCTDNRLHPVDLDKLWKKPVPVLAHSVLFRIVRFLFLVLRLGIRPSTGVNLGNLKVQARSYVIPIENVAQIDANGVFVKVLDRHVGQVFSSLPLQAVLQYKWEAYGSEVVIDEFIIFSLLVTLFTVYGVLLGYECRDSFEYATQLDTPRHVFLLLSMLFSLYGLYSELKQMVIYCKQGRGFEFYWVKSKWNGLEFFTYIMVVFVIPSLELFDGHPCSSRFGLSWAVPLTYLLLWWKILYYGQAFKSTGPMVLMILSIIGDILMFLVIAFFVMFGFGTAYFVLYRGDEDNTDVFGSWESSCVAVFAMMLGDFELEKLYKTHVREISVALFVAYEVMMMIILLNLLIALMGDSFERIKEAEEEQFLRVRASILDDMDTMLPLARKKYIKEGIRKYVHVLIPTDLGIEEWQGRMLEMEKRFRKALNTTKTEFRKLMRERADILQENISNVAGQTSLLEEKLDHMEEQILGALGKSR